MPRRALSGCFNAILALAPIGWAHAQEVTPYCGAFPDDTDGYVCECPALNERSGQVWGSGPYTLNSEVCMAATHAGKLGLDGGFVLAWRSAGASSYESSVRNGVESSRFGAFAESFVFSLGEVQ
jgi:LCCL domain